MFQHSRKVRGHGADAILTSLAQFDFLSNLAAIDGAGELDHKAYYTNWSRFRQERINPVAYLADDGRYVVIASRGGAPANPAWYHNLMAHPDATIEVGRDTIDVVASEATGEDASACTARRRSASRSSRSTRNGPNG